MYEIPQSINVLGKQFDIRNKGDFRMVLDCFTCLQDIELTDKEKIAACLIIFYADCNDISDINNFPDVEVAVQEMFKFFNCGQEASPGANVKHKLIDWQKDEQLICSAINNVAGKEIRFEPYIHWWTFMGYYTAIGESCLATVVSIRSKIVEGRKLEKHERKFRQDNPQYFDWDFKTAEQKEAEQYIQSIWNSGKK